MGGAVSSGRDHHELIDNLVGGNYIRTESVERVFRALDRADYMLPEARDQAYKDLAWRHGFLHMSAPCIYSEVMESLELKPGLSFLNIGSGTGYLNTMVGLIIGPSGINHGVEMHMPVVEYAVKKLSQFIENSATPDEFEFCEPKFFCGNGLCLAPLQSPYDRVYCGAACPRDYENYFKRLIKVGGVLVMPLNDHLLQVRRVGPEEWSTRRLLHVSFATLQAPHPAAAAALDPLQLDTLVPVSLQLLCRGVVRAAMRGGVLRRNPGLRPPQPPPHPPAKKPCARRVCFPLDHDSDVELNTLHDLDAADPASGAREMNALLSLVLNMGSSRVAGALRYQPSSSDSEEEPPSAPHAEPPSATPGPDSDNAPAPPPRPRPNLSNLFRSRFRRSTSSEGSDAPPSVPPRPSWTLSGNCRPGSRRCFKHYRVPLVPPSADSQSRNASLDGIPRTSGIIMVQLTNDLATRPIPESQQSSSREDSTDNSPAPGSDPTSRTESQTTTESDDNAIPAEVEIYLGNVNQPRSGSYEDLEEMEEDVTAEEDNNDEERVNWGESSKRKEKRVKLDSGIGEENCASTSTSSGESTADRSERTASSASSVSTPSTQRSTSSNDDTDDGLPKILKRKQSRCRVSWWPSSVETVSEREGREERGEETVARGEREEHEETERRGSRGRSRGRGRGQGARCVRLSVLMKQSVKELPLPHVLKKFINLERCYQF